MFRKPTPPRVVVAEHLGEVDPWVSTPTGPPDAHPEQRMVMADTATTNPPGRPVTAQQPPSELAEPVRSVLDRPARASLDGLGAIHPQETTGPQTGGHLVLGVRGAQAAGIQGQQPAYRPRNTWRAPTIPWDHDAFIGVPPPDPGSPV